MGGTKQAKYNQLVDTRREFVLHAINECDSLIADAVGVEGTGKGEVLSEREVRTGSLL
jgi:hypothetical protein